MGILRWRKAARDEGPWFVGAGYYLRVSKKREGSKQQCERRELPENGPALQCDCPQPHVKVCY